MQKKFLRTSLVVVGLFCSSLNPTNLMAGLNDELDVHVGTIVRHAPGRSGHGDASRDNVRAWYVSQMTQAGGVQYHGCNECSQADNLAKVTIFKYVPDTHPNSGAMTAARREVYTKFLSAVAGRL